MVWRARIPAVTVPPRTCPGLLLEGVVVIPCPLVRDSSPSLRLAISANPGVTPSPWDLLHTPRGLDMALTFSLSGIRGVSSLPLGSCTVVRWFPPTNNPPIRGPYWPALVGDTGPLALPFLKRSRLLLSPGCRVYSDRDLSLSRPSPRSRWVNVLVRNVPIQS